MFGDPKDNIKYTPKELIQKASDLGYDVLSITSHRKVIFSEDLRNFAIKKGIILLPGIELEINGKDILAINIDKKIENIRSFKELEVYKKSHTDCLVIAAHPFFIFGSLMKRKLIKNIDIFDAIEHSFFYSKSINLNKPAAKIAKKYNKPIISTSDCHLLEHLDIGYTLVNSKKEISSLIKAIKNKQIKIHSTPLTIFGMIKIFLKMLWQTKLS